MDEVPIISDNWQIKFDLYRNILERNWKEVAEIYKKYPDMHTAKVTKSLDTALHIAVTVGAEAMVVELVNVMKERDMGSAKTVLEARNERGDTPLHCAAARGSRTMCECMLFINPSLVDYRNDEMQSPLFLAALHGHKDAFLYLHSVTSVFRFSMAPPWRCKGGDTILHCTIRGEHFDLAFRIIHLYQHEYITSSVDENGFTPLHVLATKPSAFGQSTHLRFWNKILYHFIPVEPLKFDRSDTLLVEVESDQARLVKPRYEKGMPENYRTCHNIFKFLWALTLFLRALIASVVWILKKEGSGRNSEAGISSSYENLHFPRNYATCLEFYKFLFDLSGLRKGLKKIKQKHIWCAQIMNELVKQISADNKYITDGGVPTIDESDEEMTSIVNLKKKPDEDGLKYANRDQDEETDHRMTVLLTAVKYGAIELVIDILKRNPLAIFDTTKGNKNILHVAVENRQPHILKALQKYDVWENLRQMVDAKGNNLLHLAAKGSKYKPWQTPGSAVQMQWDIKWYQFVKDMLPKHLIFRTNQDGRTPGEIFHEKHKELLKESSEWLKSTSESCSVVAALIAGVSFATCSAVPGGTDGLTGKPVFKGQPAFDIFAIASLVALCFSVTALIMFLAILSSRQKFRDFHRNLPLKLLVGLSSLFVSIASMLISFCAAYFFVLKDQLNKMLLVIYAACCLPVLFYAEAQLPLYLDIVQAILEDVPQPIYMEDDV